MSDTPVMDWTVAYGANWAVLSNARISVIEQYIERCVSGLAPGEVNRAVARLAATWSGREHPGVKDIVAAILAGRGNAKYGPDGKNLHGYKRRMQEVRTDPGALWEIICEPKDAAECRELEDFAEATMSFARDKVPFIAEIQKRLANRPKFAGGGGEEFKSIGDMVPF